MKRIIMMLAMATLFVVGMALSAAPAFAAPCVQNPDNKNCHQENPGGQTGGCENNGGQNCTLHFKNR
jgi:hypothetical protein